MRNVSPLIEQCQFKSYVQFNGEQLIIQCEHKPGDLVLVSVEVEYIIAGSSTREVHKDIAFQPGAVIGIGKMK